MALADSVPGVSGGTIAFVLGFYDKFIESLKNIFTGSRDERIKAIKFLLNLGVGWIIGMVLSIVFITSVFESHIYEISSLFLGFIIVSIPLIIKEEKKSFLGNYKFLLLLLIGIVLVWAMTFFNPATSFDQGIDLSVNELTIFLGLFIFIAGMIAISAMVLPGISGSTILLIFGLYAPILAAVKEVIKFNFAYLPSVSIFIIGIILGISITIKGVKYLLENHRAQTLYFVLGLMIGSLYSVVMGAQSLKIPKPPLSIESFSISYFIMGGVLIVLLESFKNFMVKNKSV
jgi:putative membrane protein